MFSALPCTIHVFPCCLVSSFHKELNKYVKSIVLICITFRAHLGKHCNWGHRNSIGWKREGSSTKTFRKKRIKEGRTRSTGEFLSKLLQIGGGIGGEWFDWIFVGANSILKNRSLFGEHSFEHSVLKSAPIKWELAGHSDRTKRVVCCVTSIKDFCARRVLKRRLSDLWPAGWRVVTCDDVIEGSAVIFTQSLPHIAIGMPATRLDCDTPWSRRSLCPSQSSTNRRAKCIRHL